MKTKYLFVLGDRAPVKYEMLRIHEHRFSGATLRGEPHDWHIYPVVAKKT